MSEVTQNPAASRFELEVDGHIAAAYYEQIKGLTQMMGTPQMRMPYDIVIR